MQSSSTNTPPRRDRRRLSRLQRCRSLVLVGNLCVVLIAAGVAWVHWSRSGDELKQVAKFEDSVTEGAQVAERDLAEIKAGDAIATQLTEKTPAVELEIAPQDNSSDEVIPGVQTSELVVAEQVADTVADGHEDLAPTPEIAAPQQKRGLVVGVAPELEAYKPPLGESLLASVQGKMDAVRNGLAEQMLFLQKLRPPAEARMRAETIPELSEAVDNPPSTTEAIASIEDAAPQQSDSPEPRELSDGASQARPKLVLINPNDTGGEVSFLLDGVVLKLLPGEIHEIDGSSAGYLQFHRGDDFGYSEYALTPGVYTFDVTDNGWDIAQLASRSQAPGIAIK